MNDTPIEPMSADNVEEFDVWIFESRDFGCFNYPAPDSMEGGH
jgi:hypothetical protein